MSPRQRLIHTVTSPNSSGRVFSTISLAVSQGRCSELAIREQGRARQSWFEQDGQDTRARAMQSTWERAPAFWKRNHLCLSCSVFSWASISLAVVVRRVASFRRNVVSRCRIARKLLVEPRERGGAIRGGEELALSASSVSLSRCHVCDLSIEIGRCKKMRLDNVLSRPAYVARVESSWEREKGLESNDCCWRDRGRTVFLPPTEVFLTVGTEAWSQRPLLDVSRVSFLRIVSLGMVIEEELLGSRHLVRPWWLELGMTIDWLALVWME